MLYVKHAKLVLETGILWDGVLAIEGDRIAAYGSPEQVLIPEGAEVLDADGLYLGPGFVDIHVHGGDGDFFYSDPEKVCHHFVSHGETTVLPTFYYDMSKQQFLDGIERVRTAMKEGKAGKAIGGIYMEGPYMNPRYGACAEKNLWKGEISAEDYGELLESAGELARVWAIAPEREGIEGFMADAKRANPNTVFSVGHSEATPEQIRRIKHYGVTLQTHCMDATGRISMWGGTRGCGPDEYCMSNDDMYAELICDSRGVHVNPDLIRMILKIKGLDRIVLITDSSVGEGDAPEGLRGVKDLMFDANGGLCGSKLTLDVVCRNIMTHTSCGIAQAFLMASRNPAQAVGLGDELGTIAVGKRANLVLVDDAFDVKTVILNGEIYPDHK
jgi:N-acetylglucosamine-6-phosphate deacetylase